MPNDPGYLDFVLETLAPLGEITQRAMMGGHTLYCDGLVFAIVANNALYLKADKETEGQFLAAGLPAFRPFPNKPDTMRYHLAPAEFFESTEVMQQWAGLAREAARKAKTKAKPKTKR